MRSLQQQKSDSTRLAMVEAAIEVFAEYGFNGASSRQLASAAGVNLALISYHFGGKEGLYLATFKHINTQFRAITKPLLAQLNTEFLKLTARHNGKPSNSIIAAAHTHQARVCVQMIETILHANIELLASEQTESWAKLILREQQNPGEAFNILYSSTMSDVLSMLTKLIAFIQHKKVTDDCVKFSALSLLGQVQILRSARASVVKYMGWESISETEIEQLKQHISFNINAMLLASNRP